MKLRALIIEDEIPSRINLMNSITRLFDDIEIVGACESVRESVKFLSDPHNQVDMIFMDVELSDGMCFDIFDQTNITAKVVITTAYDNYAIRAFKVNSLDYILKPIDPNDLRRAVERCRRSIQESSHSPLSPIDINALRDALTRKEAAYKQRFIIRIGDKITIVNTSDIAYFYSEDKSTIAMTTDSKRYIVDQSLDAVQESIDPDRFFRISRSCIVSIGAIQSISKHLNNRLKINLVPKSDFEAFVSRFRIGDFMDWLEEK